MVRSCKGTQYRRPVGCGLEGLKLSQPDRCIRRQRYRINFKTWPANLSNSTGDSTILEDFPWVAPGVLLNCEILFFLHEIPCKSLFWGYFVLVLRPVPAGQCSCSLRPSLRTARNRIRWCSQQILDYELRARARAREDEILWLRLCRAKSYGRNLGHAYFGSCRLRGAGRIKPGILQIHRPQPGAMRARPDFLPTLVFSTGILIACSKSLESFRKLPIQRAALRCTAMHKRVRHTI